MNNNELFMMGCIGKITSFIETPDYRIVLNLEGVCRFVLKERNLSPNGYDGFRFHCPENSENEWCRIGVSLQTAISSIRRYRPVEFFPKEPLSLHSVGIYSNSYTEASALDISDISVIDGSGKNITIIENFSELEEKYC